MISEVQALLSVKLVSGNATLMVRTGFAIVRSTRHLGHELWKARIVLLGPFISITVALVRPSLLRNSTLVRATLRVLLIISSRGNFCDVNYELERLLEWLSVTVLRTL